MTTQMYDFMGDNILQCMLDNMAIKGLIVKTSLIGGGIRYDLPKNKLPN